MSQEKESKEVKFRNSVKIVGYLKETTLQERVSQNGKHFISGNITVAVNEFNTHRVRFQVFKEDNEEKYNTLAKFLPSNTVSIASYLKSTPTANFATASGLVAKIWLMAGFEEYAVRKGENEKSSVLLRGYSIGFSDPNKTFEPSATFEIDMYIKEVEDEVLDDNPTGRLLITGVIPAYNELVYVLPLVAPVEENVAAYMKKVYQPSDTVRVNGDLVAMRVEDDNTEEDTGYIGRQNDRQYTTHFVREYVIRGGVKNPIHQGEQGSLSNEAVKKGLAKRENLMVENGKRKPKSGDDGSAAPASEAPATTPATTPAAPAKGREEEFDF